jgi:hypothetical protein
MGKKVKVTAKLNTLTSTMTAQTRILEGYGVGKVGIISLMHKGKGGSIDELETELRVALEGTVLTKTWMINKVTVLDSGEEPYLRFHPLTDT